MPHINTQKYYDKIFDWVLHYGPKILVAIVVLIIGEWLIKFLNKRVKAHFSHQKYAPSLRPFFQSLVFTCLQVLLVLLVMQILGIQLTIFAALIGALGVAAGLALSGTLQNFASGVLILLLKPFNVGDNIVAQGQTGTVTSIQIFYTIITTFDNQTVVMPNSKLSNDMIINITAQGKRRLDIELKFKYDVDPETVKKAVQDIIKESKDMLNDPQARVGIASLDNDTYTIRVNVWLKAHGFEDTRLIVNEQLLKGLKEKGLKLPGMG